MRRACRIALAVFALSAGGCQAFIAGVSAPSMLKQDRVNLLNASYASADTLARQSQRKFSPDYPLVVSDLRELVEQRGGKKPVTNPGVGRLLTGQLRERFTQLGYLVADERGNSSGNAGVVSGTYELKDGRMAVDLQMVNRRTGRIVATDSYSLPITYDIRKYMTRDPNSLPVFEPMF